MIPDDGMKEVYFHEYCKTCKHESVSPTEDPCDDCLSEPMIQYSHKPVRWEEKE